MATTDFYNIVALVNSIEAASNRQSKALSTANEAMRDAHGMINDLVHFVRRMNEKPITQNERVILQKLYDTAKVLSEASIKVKFELDGE